MPGDKELLDNFSNEPNLKALEKLLSKFNIFDALDLVNREKKHSQFLVWLLKPKESHGLSDTVLKNFLVKFTQLAKAKNIIDFSPIDIDENNFNSALVEPERMNIDILIVDEINKLVCAIENKIHSDEHTNQLDRYKSTIDRMYPNHRKLFVYLTIEGEEASNPSYISISYNDVCNIIEEVISVERDKINREAKIFISHYTDMVRRFHLENSEIQQLCDKIYAKHKKALKIINDNATDELAERRGALIDLINSEPQLMTDDCTTRSIRFTARKWDVDQLRKGTGYTSTKRILLFEFQNRVSTLTLALIIGPGETAVRQRIYDQIKNSPRYDIFRKNKLTPEWATVYSNRLLNSKDMEDREIDELQPIIKEKWESFLKGDFKTILNCIEQIL